MNPYTAYPQAVGPPVRAPVVRVRGKTPILPILGVLAMAGAAIFAYLRFFKTAASQGTVTVTAAHNDTISQATNGNPSVSAAAGGAVLAAPVASATSVLVETPAQAVAAAAAAAPAAVASAAASPSSGGALSSYKNMTTLGPAGSGLCMSEGGPNGQVALYWCYNGQPQKWAFDASAGSIKGNSSGGCVTALQRIPGSTVITTPCTDGAPNQEWTWLGSGFQLQGTTNCLDSTTLSNGATMSLTPCSGAASQTFTKS